MRYPIDDGVKDMISTKYDTDTLNQIKAASGCFEVRQLNDGTVVGLGRLLYITAVYVGLTLFTWSSRFCYDDADLALTEYHKLHTGQDEPSGWIARRPQEP